MKLEMYYMGKKITYKDLSEMFGEQYTKDVKETVKDCKSEGLSYTWESCDGSIEFMVY